MCGIFAAISIQQPFPKENKVVFDQALNTLAHRGPDAGNSEIFSLNQSESDFQIYLGHRRLSIIDLDPSSNQPFESGNIHIVFNGEIYNYIELRKEIENEFQWKTNSDTEVIINYYRKYGIKGFEKFNGMWAFILYDATNRKLIISRDRFSIKPLFICERNGQMYLSSEIKALKKVVGNLTPNINTIERFLNQMLIDTNQETFYQEIKIFPAMSALEIDLNSQVRKSFQYWNFSQPEMPKSYEERKIIFRELLLDSLKLRLRSDVPLGTLLSGGLDSSAITTLINDHLNSDVQSFSVVSDEKKYNEEEFVDILVKTKKINNHKLRFKPEAALENIQRVLDVQDEPYGSLSVVAQYMLFEKIKKEAKITVLLSGQGADEVLLGYHKYFFFYLQQLQRQKKFFRMGNLATASLLKGTSVRQFTWKQAKRYLPGRTNKGRNYFLKSLAQDQIWKCDSMSDRQIQDINQYSIPQLAHYEDRNSMANHLEIRLPFMDYRLVNFLVHAPVEDKLKGGWTKYILRDTATELPKEIRWRKDKQGFVTPEEKWLKGALGNYIADYFNKPSRLSEMGILDQKKFADAVLNFRSDSKWLGNADIFSVFITEMWLRENF